MKTNANDLAFGQVTYHTADGGGMESGTLTKREYFAAMALTAFLQNKGLSTFDAVRNTEGLTDDVADACVAIADRLIEALNKGGPQ